MEYSFEALFYLEPEYFEEMVRLCRQGMEPQDAINEVSYKLDDFYYYSIEYVEDQIIEDIKEALKEN